MFGRILFLLFSIIFICGCATTVNKQSPRHEERLELTPYASEERIRELVTDLLPRSGRPKITIGKVQDMGAVFVVNIVDQQSAVIRNEIFIRKDGAAMPLYGVLVNGKPLKHPVDSPEKARSMAAIWLWRTDQKNMLPGAFYQTDLAYVVEIKDAKEPKKIANQIIVRSDGFLLPVGNGRTVIPLSAGGHYPGEPEFDWIDEFNITDIPESDIWWGNDWDTGWWGSGWGWGWGSAGTWKPPNDDDEECPENSTQLECFCLRACREQCKSAPPDRCFEDCADECLGPRG